MLFTDLQVLFIKAKEMPHSHIHAQAPFYALNIEFVIYMQIIKNHYLYFWTPLQCIPTVNLDLLDIIMSGL